MNRIALALLLSSVACGPGIIEDAVCSADGCALCVTDADCKVTCSEDPESGSTCVDGICVIECDCIESCDQAGAICGLVDNGCGGTLDCGSCSESDTLESLSICLDRQDCGVGEICDPSGQCIADPAACQSDGDCLDGFGCAPMGRCVRVCIDDSNCVLPPGAPADLTLVCLQGLCVPGEPSPPGCTSDVECLAGATCESGQCVSAVEDCSSDADCTGDQICVDSDCVSAPVGCATAADCTGDQICVDSDCVSAPVGCATDADCTGDDICVAPPGCTDGDCPPPKCVPAPVGCTTDVDCADGMCGPAGVCMQAPLNCTSNAECIGGTLCNTVIHVCVPPCTTSADCMTPPSAPPGLILVCNPTLGYCVPQ